MAQYKVPQDVEAEDKLIGWLSFRQLIYAGIAAGAAAMCFFTFQLFPPLALIPLPFAILFTILILPLRKEQPMETYLIAIVRFYLKSKIRKWDPDGVPSYVEIVTPAREEKVLTKTYGAETAQERLDYLARIMDSRGWAYKQLTGAPDASNLTSDIAAEASNAVDVLDEHTSISQSFKNLIQRDKEVRRQSALEKMRKAQEKLVAPPEPAPKISQVRSANDQDTVRPTYNPYPAAIHQKVILPEGEKPKAPPEKPVAAMTPQVSPDIIRLATTSEGLTVSTLSKEAQRLEKKANEVVVELRKKG